MGVVAMAKTLEDMLIEHEGKKLKAYVCTAGKATIGVGRNLDDVGITDDEAIYLLRNDIKRVQRELSGFRWFSEISQNRRNAVTDMCFNIGITRFSQFKDMIAAIEAKDYEKAAAEMLNSRWASQVGKRAITLANIMRVG